MTISVAVVGLSAPAHAAGTVSGRITLADGTTPVPGTTVVAQRSGGGGTVAQATAGDDGRYSLTVSEPVIDLVVTPPPSSGYGVARVRDVDTSADTTVDVSLVLAATVTWSGTLRDGTGAPIRDAMVALFSPSTQITTNSTTTTDGRFSVSVAPGTYRLYVNTACCRAGKAEINASTGDFTLTQDRTDDIVLPTHTVRIRVVDPSGNPVPGTQIAVATRAIPTAIPGFPATTGNNTQYYNDTTDADGIATVQLLSTTTTPSHHTANITAPPATTLPKTAFNLTGLDSERTLVISFSRSAVDVIEPSVTCTALPTQWSASDVTAECTASDSGTGLRHAADAAFTLTTSIPDGTESANATAGPRQVCDLADNCTIAQVNGGRVDRKAPVVQFSLGSSAQIERGRTVELTYTCVDNGSGVASCASDFTSGSTLATGTLGTRTVTVSTVDQVGNRREQDFTYTVVAEPTTPQPPNPQPPTQPGGNVVDHVGYQRAETFVGLQAGQQETRTVGCPTGYLLTDSSAVVQHVDQGNDVRDVRVTRVQRQGDGAMAITVVNDTTGQAQLKLFAACLQRTTGAGGVVQVSTTASGAAALPQDASATVTCPTGTRGIAPAYDAAGGRMVRVEPLGSDGRQWAFRSDGVAGTATYSLACLSTRTSATSELQFTTVDGSVSGGDRPGSVTMTTPSGWSTIATGWSSDGGTWLGTEPQDRQLVAWAAHGRVGVTALAIRGWTERVVVDAARVQGAGKRISVRLTSRAAYAGPVVVTTAGGTTRRLGATRVTLRAGTTATVRVAVPRKLRTTARRSAALAVTVAGKRVVIRR